VEKCVVRQHHHLHKPCSNKMVINLLWAKL
jgi:hypothetical protein